MDDDTHLGYSGVDQALVPLRNFFKGSIPAYEVDLDNISSKTDLTRCFQDKTEATMSTSLRADHFEDKGGPLRGGSSGKAIDLIRKDTCRNLNWMGDNYKIHKQLKSTSLMNVLLYPGLSGSLLTLSCNNKKGFFIVHRCLKAWWDFSLKIERRAKEGQSMDFNFENQSFVNTAVHINKELLELFSDNYCEFSI